MVACWNPERKIGKWLVETEFNKIDGEAG
jgi:hypothetical protein